MNRSMLLFDIDGTLITQETEIFPESAKEAILKARENGHLAFVNTGRTTRTMPSIIRDFPFDGFICCCGAQIIYQGETIYSDLFRPEEASLIIDGIIKYNIPSFIEGPDDVYMRPDKYLHGPLINIAESFRKKGLFASGYTDDRNFDFYKFIIFPSRDHSDDENIDAFLKEIRPVAEEIDYGGRIYEILRKGNSKARGMRILAEKLGIPESDSYAFGDAANDLPMLKAAGHGIAMGVHAPALEDFAEYVTDTVENDGIKNALIHYGLI
ncbi:MAG: Cof-type HAD-IIB family hydrolase [Lachnospiraceae bacterium]|nr:Cof-type HAD-IIB family hydrolase [Lachnospiraceae bacterium]